MGILKNKTLRRHCFSYSDILANKQHGTENGINISTKSKNVLLFCDILDSSNTVGFRLGCVGSGEYYVGFNHPNCQNNLVYSPNMRVRILSPNEVYLFPGVSVLRAEFHGRIFYLEQLCHSIEK